jgi:uncharacterized Zn finger protein
MNPVGEVMREFHFDPPTLEVAHPSCGKCGAPTWLTRIEADGPDHDRHTFECKACGHVVVETVKYHGAQTRR